LRIILSAEWPQALRAARGFNRQNRAANGLVTERIRLVAEALPKAAFRERYQRRDERTSRKDRFMIDRSTTQAVAAMLLVAACGLAATAQATVLTDAVLRLEGNTSLTYDSGSNRNVWANTGTGGSAYDAKDRVTGTTGSVTQETYTLTDGVTTAKRMVFNGSTSGFQSAYQGNQLPNLTVYVVMSKATGGASGYQNLWSFDNTTGGWSRGMGYGITSGKLIASTKTPNGFTLADSSSANQVWGLSYAGNDSQTINAYSNGATITGPQNLAAEFNNDGSLDIGSLFLSGDNPQPARQTPSSSPAACRHSSCGTGNSPRVSDWRLRRI